jgi:hypothetical protein
MSNWTPNEKDLGFASSSENSSVAVDSDMFRCRVKDLLMKIRYNFKVINCLMIKT